QPTIIYEPPQAPSIEHQTILPVVKSKPSDSIQQEIINVEHPAVLVTVHPKSSDQDQQKKETEIKDEPLTSKISAHVNQSVQKVVEEYLTSTKVETKSQVRQVAPTKENILPVIASTITTEFQKRSSIEDEDEDGFRVVRYRKHVPSSPTATMATTTTTPFSKPYSHSSDSEKSQSRSSRKQISSPSTVASIGTTSQSMTLKKKPKKTEEKSAAADTALHADVRSPPTTDTDLVSSSKDEPITRTITKHIEKVVESQIITKDVSSPLHSDNQSKSTKEDHKPIRLPGLVQKTSDDTQYQIQPTESATLLSVASADTSEDSSKKTKRKHKRPKQESARVDISTTSDEVSSTTGNIPWKKTLTPSIPSPKPAVEISLTSSPIEEKSDQVLLKEQTLLSQPTIHIEDDESKIEASKKHPKQRKKKSQSSEKHDQNDNSLTSSASSTTDKDSSSATRATSTKPTAIESTTQSRLRTDDDKHESEWIVAQSKKRKSKAVESPTTPESSEPKLSLYPHSTLQPATTTKSPPEKVTDVQFKFKKSGELVVTSQVPIEHSPTEWGTVIFLSDEQPNISQKDEITVTTEDISSQQPSVVIEQQPIIEQIVDIISQTDDETKIESSPQAIESSETSGEADLDAYRDQTGRLRRKKPRKHTTSLSEPHEEENHSTEDSRSLSTSNQIEHDTIITSSSSISSAAAPKKKQRPKMLKKDIEATTLLTHEFDDTPLTITEIQAASTTTTATTQDDESFLSSTTSQSISAITDSVISSSLSAHKQTPTNEQKSLQSDEPLSSIEEPPTSSILTITEPTTTIIMRKKASTRSPRKRSKRDSGPDYENVITPTLDDVEQAFADDRVMTTAVDNDQTDFIRVETHKHQSRQRTSSGRQIINSQEDNEQQAILADDEEDDDFAVKPIVLHGTGVGTNVQTPTESAIEQHDSSATATATTTAITTSKKKRQKKKNATEEVEFIAKIPDELKSDKDDTSVSEEQPESPNEQLRPVQGFHSFTPNKYQYNQYEEVPAAPTEQTVTSTASTTATTENKDEVFARGFNLWLKQNNDNESSSTVKKDETEEPSQQQPEAVSGLTRAMQSLIIQPVESDNDEEEDDEDDSWNGPRAKKPTYTTGARAEKRIHTSSGYNVNHPRSVAISPWLMPKSNDNTYQDDSSKYDPNDSSKYDPDDEEDSINDASDRLQLSHPINTQFSTKEERQIHLNSLADLTFQATTNTLSSSTSSSLSSAVKWNETPIRTDETVPLQTNFTDDDVQRCLGEDFYRESLAVDPLHAEKRALASLSDLVLKPTQQLEETDNDDDDIDDDSQSNENNKNNNNNNTSNNFDEWGHFLDYDDEQNIILSSESTSSRILQPRVLTSYECSYARELDDDTLVTDADRSHLIDYTQHSYEHERQRYGDFACTSDDSSVTQSMTNPSSILTNSNIPRPSETFQRWRNQSNRDRDESDSRVTTISTEDQNDDEIFVSHTDGGLSRRVRPTQ
ncbi:unnamed protein product, partial [Rotaria socialis]